jgi:hypothetical protein
MVRSKTTSVTSTAMTAFLLLSIFSAVQVLCAGSHAERSSAILWIRNAMLVLQVHIAIATTIPFLFQMAIMRSTIREDAAAKAKEVNMSSKIIHSRQLMGTGESNASMLRIAVMRVQTRASE